MSAMLSKTDSRGSATEVMPASSFSFKCLASRVMRSSSCRFFEALEEQWWEIRDLITFLPLSHHFPTDGKKGCLVLQYIQKDSISDLSYGSFKMEMLHFHLPGPRGMRTGGLMERWTTEWSEKGHGTKLQNETNGAHTAGHPIKSIREAQAWSGLSQVKPGVSGWRSRQMSTTQHFAKHSRKASELSWESSSGSDPRRSMNLSKTVLKSPRTKVGIPGSTTSTQASKKSFLAESRFGAYTQRTRKDNSRMENSAQMSLPSVSDHCFCREEELLYKITDPRERFEPVEMRKS